eukprot:CAMPEP_0170570604 /NCGR_PEP_ID=MMETSP0224-20130122/1202_1 /TAXON_ID=285029 /ORGANISM="Togula jolla, Strain CCCM 725" /LENGTH=743 /DNA_ID=CAMNT_0010892899 /DNA_START=15 /DNA_END=2246 /DNA_ORIENTATION=+
MGKQGFDQKTALVNALTTKGPAQVAPAPKEKPKKDVTPGGGSTQRRKEVAEPVQHKSKKVIEEEQRQLIEENARKREEFFIDAAARKAREPVAADEGFTYVQDRDARKPLRIPDLNEHWVSKLDIMPFLPTDNVDLAEAPEDVEVLERLEYLRTLDGQLRKLLRMKFHVFWSQVIYDGQLRRCLDSYLRFSLRSHDIALDSEARAAGEVCGEDLLAEEERGVAREISRRMLAVLVRLSRPQESPRDFLSEAKYAELIHSLSIFDVPKLIDICAIYGDSNRILVTKLVHSVFKNQPCYKDEFEAVVQHMLEGLLQCCSPLHQAAGLIDDAPDLSIDECLLFLPDILGCFNAVFCFFPEECVERLVGAQIEEDASFLGADQDGTSVPLVDLMIRLYDALGLLETGRDVAIPGLGVIRPLLCRLLTCVLGFRLAPRRGATAFEELLSWLRAQDDSGRGPLLQDLGRFGLENVAQEWLASGLVDDAQLDFLEQLCGPVLGTEGRKVRRTRPSAPVAGTAAGSGSGGAASSREQVASSDSASDMAKIREVREVVGSEYGDGFVLQCLLHYGGSVPAVVGGILDGSLPPQLAALPHGLKLGGQVPLAAGSFGQEEINPLSAEEKRRVVAQAGRMDREFMASMAAAAEAGVNEYDDDYDDAMQGGLGVPVGGNGSASERSESEGESSDNGNSRWPDAKGKGGKGGKGKGRGRGPVQGQTIGARRKEENKAAVGNHHRRDRALQKLRKGMF